LAAEKMKLTPKSREVEGYFGWADLKIGILIGIRNLTKPTSILRLGIIWVVLDPLMLSAIYSFLFSITGRAAEAASIVIGVMTLRSFNNSFKTGYSMNLSVEPFPLKHTSTKIFLLSKISIEVLQSMLIGITGSVLLILIFGSPYVLSPYMTFLCAALSLIGVGIGMILSPYVSRFGDLGKLFSYVLFLSFFLQPCLYDYSITSGIHREVLSYIPFTFAVEFLRTVAFGNPYPFEIGHVTKIMTLWIITAIIGFKGADKERWRSTAWS